MYVKATFSFTIVHVNLPQYQPNKGFFSYLTGSQSPNTILNTPKTTTQLIDYFKADQAVQ